MIAAKKNNTRIAESEVLYSIEWVQQQLFGAQKLSSNARGYLWFLLALVKRGYVSIAAPQRIIADAYFRATGGNKSVRSLQYAFRELEEYGYIRRSKYRIGDDHFRSIININSEAFVFWTRQRVKDVVPIRTRSHISSCAQNLPEDPGTEINHRNSVISSVNENTEPRASARSKTSAKRFNFFPVLWSVMVVLKINPWNYRKKPLDYPVVELCERELSGRSNVTGIRWKRWSSEWQRMPHVEREGIVRTSFIPRLRAAIEGGGGKIAEKLEDNVPRPEKIHNTVRTVLEESPATSQEVRDLLQSASFYPPKQDIETADTDRCIDDNSQDDREPILSRRDLDVLELARKRVQDWRQWMIEE